ncbi:MAG: ComF family protein [Candidatus Levybacteria bacterium]|nr:ComF family protein [Candidatus Levybacteria bacterium]
MDFLNLIFPKYCVGCKKLGRYLCDKCFSYLSFDTQGICVVCNHASTNNLTHPGCKTKYTIDGIFSSLSYNPIVKKLIYNFKYRPYLSDLKKLLIDLFFEGLIQREEFYNTNQYLKGKSVLVPIPLHVSKMRIRGYNQSEILAKGLEGKLNLKKYDFLKRIKKTVSQAGLSQKERRKNISGAFAVFSDISLDRYPNIFLVDDIFTTGSTLNEAAKVLKRAGVKSVWGLTLARD